VRLHNIAPEIKLSLQLGYFVTSAIRAISKISAFIAAEAHVNRSVYFHVVYLSSVSGSRKISMQRITRMDLHHEVFSMAALTSHINFIQLRNDNVNRI